MVAEALGASNQSQIVDLTLNNNNPYTVGYAIYENGNPMRVVLINFLNDQSGASDLIATIMIGGGSSGQPGANPSTARVRYLAAPSVTEKHNMTWGGQSWGSLFSSDGRPQGNASTLTVQCDPNNGKECSPPSVHLLPGLMYSMSLRMPRHNSRAWRGPRVPFGSVTHRIRTRIAHRDFHYIHIPERR